jgi:hypothetical protein
MTATTSPLLTKEIISHILIGKADIPLTLIGFEKLPSKSCELQTTRSSDFENTHFLIHEESKERVLYVIHYNQSGRLITYDRLSDWDKDSILTIHSE